MRQGVQPIFVPQTIKKFCIHASFEERVLDFVVLVGMQAEVLEFLGGHGRDSRDFLSRFELLCVIICVGAEDTNLDLASRHGLLRVNDNGKCWVLNHLLLLLSLHVNTR